MLAELVAQKLIDERDFKAKLKNIKCIVTDVDGVMTDGTIFLDSQGNEIKTFCVKDAPRISAARRCAIATVMFTGRKSLAAEARVRELKCDIWYKADLKAAKRSLYDEVKITCGANPDEVLYIGDDWNDLPFMRLAGISVTPADGREECKQIATLVAKAPGGQGVLSEVIELVLRAQGKWEAMIQRHFDESAEVKN